MEIKYLLLLVQDDFFYVHIINFTRLISVTTEENVIYKRVLKSIRPISVIISILSLFLLVKYKVISGTQNFVALGFF